MTVFLEPFCTLLVYFSALSLLSNFQSHGKLQEYLLYTRFVRGNLLKIIGPYLPCVISVRFLNLLCMIECTRTLRLTNLSCFSQYVIEALDRNE